MGAFRSGNEVTNKEDTISSGGSSTNRTAYPIVISEVCYPVVSLIRATNFGGFLMNNKLRWLSHIYLLLKNAIEKCNLDIQLIERPSAHGNKSNGDADRHHLGNRREGLLIVHTIGLRVVHRRTRTGPGTTVSDEIDDDETGGGGGAVAVAVVLAASADPDGANLNLLHLTKYKVSGNGSNGCGNNGQGGSGRVRGSCFGGRSKATSRKVGRLGRFDVSGYRQPRGRALVADD
ncbi:hypothetical protein AKJ16_DCAP05722 [Drosera capensis]